MRQSTKCIPLHRPITKSAPEVKSWEDTATARAVGVNSNRRGVRDYQGLPFTFSILAFSRQAVYESNEIFDEHVQSKPICYQPVLEIYIHIVL